MNNRLFFSIDPECARACCAADKPEALPPSERWRKGFGEKNKRKGNNMHSRNTEHGTAGHDPEATMQERPNPLAWFVFHTVAIWSAVFYWLKFRRVCAWHQPKPQHMGGNPIARRVTHGICPECFARVSGEIISHGETDLRVSVTKVGQQGEASLPAPPARNCAVPAWLQRPSAGDTDTTRTAILRGKPFPG